jgi:hypothetical protein
MNRTALYFQIDAAHRDEARKFLGQIFRFENVLVIHTQQTYPCTCYLLVRRNHSQKSAALPQFLRPKHALFVPEGVRKAYPSLPSNRPETAYFWLRPPCWAAPGATQMRNRVLEHGHFGLPSRAFQTGEEKAAIDFRLYYMRRRAFLQNFAALISLRQPAIGNMRREVSLVAGGGLRQKTYRSRSDRSAVNAFTLSNHRTASVSAGTQ